MTNPVIIHSAQHHAASIFNIITGVIDHAFTFFYAGQDLRNQAVALANVNHALAGTFAFHDKHRPAILVTKQAAGRNL